MQGDEDILNSKIDEQTQESMFVYVLGAFCSILLHNVNRLCELFGYFWVMLRYSRTMVANTSIPELDMNIPRIT